MPQPVIYEMTAVPALTPVTVTGEPVEPTVTTDVLLLLHVPPVVVSVSVPVEPTVHKVNGVPPIAAVAAPDVITAVW